MVFITFFMLQENSIGLNFILVFFEQSHKVKKMSPKMVKPLPILCYLFYFMINSYSLHYCIE